MSAAENEIIERIKKLGNVIVATPTALYSRGGTYLAFLSRQKTVEARDAFLRKYCVPFTKEESDIMLFHKMNRLTRYKRLILKAIAEEKFRAITRLAEKAEAVHDVIFEENLMWERYFHLKEGL